MAEDVVVEDTINCEPLERITQVRSLLKEALDRPSWIVYISAVANFIDGRIGRGEFGLLIESILGSASLLFNLHNQYILAVLELLARRQAEREEAKEAAAAIGSASDRLNPARLVLQQLSKQDEQFFSEALSLNRGLLEKISKALETNDPEDRLLEELCKAEKVLGRPILSRHSMSLPDGTILKERLMAACRVHGLEEASVTDDLVLLMQRSLEEYLLRIIIDDIVLTLVGEGPVTCTVDHLRQILIALNPCLNLE